MRYQWIHDKNVDRRRYKRQAFPFSLSDRSDREGEKADE
jgi:hypothetical protein